MTNTLFFFVLTGDPGVGKTTLIKKINSGLNDKGIKTIGFLTEEVRKNGVREGFDIVSLNGLLRGRLARAQNLLNMNSKYIVGKYVVLLEEFENIALPLLKQPECADPYILVIDEIGKMEFFSKSFKSRIKDVFSPVSNNVVLATIPSRKSDPIIEAIRSSDRAQLWTVTRENRGKLHEEIICRIMSVIQH